MSTVVVVVQVWQPETDLKMHVLADMSDGSTNVEVLSYYSDELHFFDDQFVGKTEEQINDMFLRADVAYLQS
jgi:hypothetical protein